MDDGEVFTIEMNSAADIWTSAVALLEKELTPTAVSTWFYDAEAMELREDQLVLCVPTEFKKNIILSRYLPHLKKVLYDLFAADMDVVIFTREEADRYRAQGPRNENVLIGNEEFTFEHFIVGSSNQFAYNAALNVANNPGRSYNPLFIYGESGLGKTHLLYAIYHTIRKRHPDFNIIFIKGDEFTNELFEAIRLRSTDTFRQKYRDKDLLLVREGEEIPLEEVALSETGFRFTIPSSSAFGSYKLCVDRVDNTRIELADIELVDEIEVSDVHLALDECPVNEPIVVYGTGFYAGDAIRFVSKEAEIDETSLRALLEEEADRIRQKHTASPVSLQEDAPRP